MFDHHSHLVPSIYFLRSWISSFKMSFVDESCRALSACFLLHVFKCCIKPLLERKFLLHSMNSFSFLVISSILLCMFSTSSLNLYSLVKFDFIWYLSLLSLLLCFDTNIFCFEQRQSKRPLRETYHSIHQCYAKSSC